PEQLLSERRSTGAADTRQGRGRRCKRNAAHDDMESGGCIFVRLCSTGITGNRLEPQPSSFNLSMIPHPPSPAGEGANLSLGGDRCARTASRSIPLAAISSLLPPVAASSPPRRTASRSPRRHI